MHPIDLCSAICSHCTTTELESLLSPVAQKNPELLLPLLTGHSDAGLSSLHYAASSNAPDVLYFLLSLSTRIPNEAIRGVGGNDQLDRHVGAALEAAPVPVTTQRKRPSYGDADTHKSSLFPPGPFDSAEGDCNDPPVSVRTSSGKNGRVHEEDVEGRRWRTDMEATKALVAHLETQEESNENDDEEVPHPVRKRSKRYSPRRVASSPAASTAARANDVEPTTPPRLSASATVKSTLPSSRALSILLDTRCRIRLWTPLHASAYAGALDATRVLLAAGVNIDAADTKGCTALHVAIQAQAASVVAALLDAGADVHHPVAGGGTALHLAAALPNRDIANLLLAAGANARAVDEVGDTPLHWAAREDAAPCASLPGLRITQPVRNADGETPYDVAMSVRAHAVAEILS